MKHFEFWHPRVFEVPYYAYLLARCALRGMQPRTLLKANYALDHGELGLGSKFSTQQAFAQARFPATALLTLPDAILTVQEFAREHGYPIIIKPLIGVVGKGVVRVTSEAELEHETQRLQGEYVAQAYCPDPYEYGVFFIRQDGIPRITGINQKHFPEVTGNGRENLGSLARAHPRYTAHWGMFLRYLDLDQIPPAGQVIRLSFIGSHTMGCRFTDDSRLVTPELERALFAVCDSQPGFNFGRFDVKTPSQAAFQAGEFTIIEVNGIASLPTHMFDPSYRLRDAYRIFMEHGRYLVNIAYEHRHQLMPFDGYRALWRRAKHNAGALDAMQAQVRS